MTSFICTLSPSKKQNVRRFKIFVIPTCAEAGLNFNLNGTTHRRSVTTRCSSRVFMTPYGLPFLGDSIKEISSHYRAMRF